MAQLNTKAALSQVLNSLLDDMLTHANGVVAGNDIEELHKFRVALRKTRALLKLFAPSLPPAEHFAAEFRWFAAVTGPVRDLDVLLQRAREHVPTALNIASNDLAPIIDLLQRKRDTAHSKLRRALASSRWNQLTHEWSSFIGSDLATNESIPTLNISTRVVVKPLLLKQCIKIIKIGRTIDADTPPSTLHHLRIHSKRTRYLLDTMSPFLNTYYRAISKQLVILQDVLGEHQDAVATVAQLTELETQLLRQSRALTVLRQWNESLEVDRTIARNGFAKAFKRFLKACHELD